MDWKRSNPQVGKLGLRFLGSAASIQKQIGTTLMSNCVTGVLHTQNGMVADAVNTNNVKESLDKEKGAKKCRVAIERVPVEEAQKQE
jgi:hypothetical protein